LLFILNKKLRLDFGAKRLQKEKVLKQMVVASPRSALKPVGSGFATRIVWIDQVAKYFIL
jgi:hypothetical protein